MRYMAKLYPNFFHELLDAVHLFQMALNFVQIVVYDFVDMLILVSRLGSLFFLKELGHFFENLSPNLCIEHLRALFVQRQLFHKVNKISFNVELLHALAQALEVVEKHIGLILTPLKKLLVGLWTFVCEQPVDLLPEFL